MAMKNIRRGTMTKAHTKGLASNFRRLAAHAQRLEDTATHLIKRGERDERARCRVLRSVGSSGVPTKQLKRATGSPGWRRPGFETRVAPSADLRLRSARGDSPGPGRLAL